MWRHLISILGSALFGLTWVIRLAAGEAAQEPRRVEVERKTVFVSNGPAQKPFDLTRHTVRLWEIKRSVPKDAIPAVVHPKFVTAGEVGKLLRDQDRVLGVYLNGETKAYPVRILNWHELVNDEVGGQPVLVTW